MKILYLSYINSDKQFIGIKKKISEQVSAIELLGNEVHFTFIEDNEFYYFDGSDKRLINSFKNKHNIKFNKYKNLFNFITINKIECIYMRYPLFDWSFIKFAKKLNNKQIKIFIEIPTFPYDNELTFKWRSIDRFFRRFILKYVTTIVISSVKKEKIFGINTIFTDNCVNSKNIKFLNRCFDNNVINMIAVSYIRKTNGYDRIIEGLKDYYKKGGQRLININFIGNGEEVQFLNDLVKQYNLEDKIKFIGSKIGSELDHYFDNADLAIGSLADHRDNIFSKAPLKSREYCARGIPFISAIEDPGFLNSEEFILRFPSNDQPIDIEKVIRFYDNLKGKDISNKMRKYALENFDWVKQYSKIEYFKNTKKIL